MITFKINGTEYVAGDVTEETLNGEILGRRREGLPVCVVARVEMRSVNVTLSAGQCGPSHGGGRPPTAEERQVFEAWNRTVKDRSEFNGNDLIAFVKSIA